MSTPHHRLAVVALHPIQYQAGLWRAMAAHPRLAQHVFFLDTIGVDGTIDPTMKAALKWDFPLTDGFSHEFLANLSPFRFTPIVQRFNPVLLRRLQAGAYDAIMVHGYLPLSNWLALLAAKHKKSTLIFRGEGSMLGQTSEYPVVIHALKERLHAYFLKSCQAVAYSCEDNRDYLLSRGAVPQTLFPMPCAVDNDVLDAFAQQAAPPAAFRERYHLPVTVRLLISVGRFDENKRMADCITALTTPPLQEQEEVHLLLAGDGPERQHLEEHARQCGVSERVHFLGFLSQKPLVEALLASDLFVLASALDRSPKAMSEALYLKLPVVCTDRVGTGKELIKPGENGYVYPCGDVAALARFSTCCLAADKRTAMGEHSHAIAKAQDFPTSVELLVNKLDELRR